MVIESPRGRIRQRAKLIDGMDPRIVAAQHAWWFPEKKDPGHGWDESNVNILTDNGYENCDPGHGGHTGQNAAVPDLSGLRWQRA